MEVGIWRKLLFILTACIDAYESTESGAGDGYCSFPRFLWQRQGNSTERQWQSRTEYFRNTDTWRKQKIIRARETEIWISSRMHASCNAAEPEGPVPCYRQEVIYRIICVSEEPDDKFRTQQNLNGKLMFSCFKFVRRTDNVVQVYQAAPNEVNEDRLCYDISLQRDDWPWIDPHPEARPSHSCYLSAGFDLTTILGDSRQKLCGSEWVPSRLEKQCDHITSQEPVRFFYPHLDCNPFSTPAHEQKLICWSEWRDDPFVFIVLSDEDKTLPRYILRLPSAAGNSTTQPLIGQLYFSTVAPLSGRGSPPGNVFYVDIHLHRSDSNGCFDESVECSNLVASGKCNSRTMVVRQTPSSSSSSSSVTSYQQMTTVSHHCLKSCKVCDAEAVRRPDCGFPSDYLGEWVGFVAPRGAVDITIATTEIRNDFFNTTLICKGKHWDQPYYQVLALQDNGCRPRYCCLHLTTSAGILNYRITGCSFTDESFQSCDTTSLPFNRIRFMRRSTVHLSQCGFSGSFLVSISFANRAACNGSLANIDDTCSTIPNLSFSLQNCSHRPQIELSCVAHGHVATGMRILITRSSDDNVFSCWVVHAMTHQEADDGVVLGGGFLLKRCSWESDVTTTSTQRFKEPVLIQAFPSYADTRCTNPFVNIHSDPPSLAKQPLVISRAALEGTPAHRYPAGRATPRPWSEAPSVYQRFAPLNDVDTNLSPRRRKEQESALRNDASAAAVIVAMVTGCRSQDLLASLLQLITTGLLTDRNFPSTLSLLLSSWSLTLAAVQNLVL